MKPRLSIISINYNNDIGLTKTMDSIIPQLTEEIEYIIVDGKSDDNSVEEMQLREKDITKWISEPDQGVYEAMNKGIRMATGEYLLFLNSGDYLNSPTILEETIADIVDTDFIIFDIEHVFRDHEEIYKHPDTLNFHFFYKRTLAHQSVVIRRSLFDQVGFYDENLKIVSDWKFFIDAFARYNSSYKVVHKVLSSYPLGGLSATKEGTALRKQERKKILESEYKLFVADNELLKYMDSNRFIILKELEKSPLAWKINSAFLRCMLFVFRGKKVKNLKQK